MFKPDAFWRVAMCEQISDVKETFELSITMKRIFGKTKLDLLLKTFDSNSREYLIYENVLENMIGYLREKYKVSNSSGSKYLPLAEYFKVLKSCEKQEGATKVC